MNDKYRKNFIYAGQLAKEVRAYGKSLIVAGASYNDIIAKIIAKIHSLGAVPAFPPQLALNHVAAHFLPNPGEDILFSNELVKLDIGVCYEGAIGDCAVTVDLSGKFQKLIDAAEAALLAAEQSVQVGQRVSEIGRIISDTIESFGFKAIKNLSGHGLGYYKVHTPPSIPNYDSNSSTLLKPGMTFAIEPFATDGKGLIYETEDATIFSLKASKPLRTEAARLLLSKIRTFNSLPFSLHELMASPLPQEKVYEGLHELLEQDVLVGYGPLVEEAHGFVAQAENSVLIDERGQVLITTR